MFSAAFAGFLAQSAAEFSGVCSRPAESFDELTFRDAKQKAGALVSSRTLSEDELKKESCSLVSFDGTPHGLKFASQSFLNTERKLDAREKREVAAAVSAFTAHGGVAFFDQALGSRPALAVQTCNFSDVVFQNVGIEPTEKRSPSAVVSGPGAESLLRTAQVLQQPTPTQIGLATTAVVALVSLVKSFRQ